MNDQPIVIETRQLVIILILLILAGSFVVGMWVTPYVHGQALLLTRDNLAVKDYLDQYNVRIVAAEKEHAALVALLAPSRPGASVASVFDLSQRARTAQDHLIGLARDVERTRVPGGLAPLDNALRAAVAAELILADNSLTFVGRADEATRADALAAAEDAQAKLAAARQAWQNTIR